MCLISSGPSIFFFEGFILNVLYKIRGVVILQFGLPHVIITDQGAEFGNIFLPIYRAGLKSQKLTVLCIRKPIRSIITLGIAGIGKTLTTQKWSFEPDLSNGTASKAIGPYIFSFCLGVLYKMSSG